MSDHPYGTMMQWVPPQPPKKYTMKEQIEAALVFIRQRYDR